MKADPGTLNTPNALCSSILGEEGGEEPETEGDNPPITTGPEPTTHASLVLDPVTGAGSSSSTPEASPPAATEPQADHRTGREEITDPTDDPELENADLEAAPESRTRCPPTTTDAPTVPEEARQTPADAPTRPRSSPSATPAIRLSHPAIIFTCIAIAVTRIAGHLPLHPNDTMLIGHDCSHPPPSTSTIGQASATWDDQHRSPGTRPPPSRSPRSSGFRRWKAGCVQRSVP